jgi:hypothetical protein
MDGAFAGFDHPNGGSIGQRTDRPFGKLLPGEETLEKRNAAMVLFGIVKVRLVEAHQGSLV